MDSDSDNDVFGIIPDSPRAEACRIGTEAGFEFKRYHRKISIAEDSSGGEFLFPYKADDITGCGGKTWEAATILSNYMAYRWSLDKNFLKGLNVVEVGAGTGVVGILAGMMMAEAEQDQEQKTGKVWVTDMLFLDLMQKNVDLNMNESERQCVKVAELKWGTPILPDIVAKPVNLILAADCVYLEAAFDPLLQTLVELSTLETTEIWIVSKKRRKADKRFFDKLKKKFNVVEIKDDPDYEVFSREGLTILNARIKGPK
ncbi:UNVERIFIED_CONTAM: hypothetical protein HDU68_009408 [Siphonaria sp. JEL0065]|nr:hypothetical protein HDU68_009408 [Siphonaria sp. JEL0065]